MEATKKPVKRYAATWAGCDDVALGRGHPDQWRSHGSIAGAYARRMVGWRVSRTAEGASRSS